MASAIFPGPGDLLARRAKAKPPIQLFKKRCRLRRDGQQDYADVQRCEMAQPTGPWPCGPQVWLSCRDPLVPAFTGASLTVCTTQRLYPSRYQGVAADMVTVSHGVVRLPQRGSAWVPIEGRAAALLGAVDGSCISIAGTSRPAVSIVYLGTAEMAPACAGQSGAGAGAGAPNVGGAWGR